MLSKAVIIGSVYEEPRRLNDNTIVLRVISKTGDHAPRPIVFHVSIGGNLIQEASELKRGDGVLIDASFKTTAQGNPPMHTYPDGQAYVQYEVIAEKIAKLKGIS
mgnify:CR=1 FL=1